MWYSYPSALLLWMPNCPSGDATYHLCFSHYLLSRKCAPQKISKNLFFLCFCFFCFSFFVFIPFTNTPHHSRQLLNSKVVIDRKTKHVENMLFQLLLRMPQDSYLYPFFKANWEIKSSYKSSFLSLLLYNNWIITQDKKKHYDKLGYKILASCVTIVHNY